jgi:pimeloyl-[acyl-carrier protein] methyl ester esterase
MPSTGRAEQEDRVRIESTGTGRELVLLHGWGMNAGAWQGVRAPLAQACRVHTVDLPGYGGSPYAGQDMETLLDALLSRLPAHFALAGWSWGGQLALHLAQRAPHRVARLVLVATPPRFVQSADWPHAVEAAVFARFAAGLEQDAAATLRRFLALQAQGEPEARQVMRQLQAAITAHGGEDPAALRWGLADLLQRDMRPAARQCQMPVLLVHGAQDALVPAAAAQWLQAALPAARLLLYPQCGHAPFVSHAEAFVQAVTEFLNE